MPKYVNVNGVWKQEGSGYVNVNGVWKPKSMDYVNVNGVWKNASPYAKAQYYGPCYSLNQAGTSSFGYNSDGSATITSMGNYYAGEESAKWRVAFSTPYELKDRDIITVYGKFFYANVGFYVGFSDTMASSLQDTKSALNLFDIYCTGTNGATWETYTSTYVSGNRTGYLHLEVRQYSSWATNTAVVSSIKINGHEIFNSLA